MNDELHRHGLPRHAVGAPVRQPRHEGLRRAPRRRRSCSATRTAPSGSIRWWNGPAAVWDFTNPKAGERFRRRLDGLMQQLRLRRLQVRRRRRALRRARTRRPMHPMTAAEYPDVYNDVATGHYGWNETRVGIYSQPLGIVQRLQDKNSVWGRENGLGALLPEALTTSLRGFFFLMPDMVGGNQYDGDRIEPSCSSAGRRPRPSCRSCSSRSGPGTTARRRRSCAARPAACTSSSRAYTYRLAEADDEDRRADPGPALLPLARRPRDLPHHRPVHAGPGRGGRAGGDEGRGRAATCTCRRAAGSTTGRRRRSKAGAGSRPTRRRSTCCRSSSARGAGSPEAGSSTGRSGAGRGPKTSRVPAPRLRSQAAFALLPLTSRTPLPTL